MVKKSFFLLLLIVLLMLSGCWDYRDLENLAIPIVGLYDLISAPGEKEEMLVGALLPVLFPEAKEKYELKFERGQSVGETREKRSYNTPETYVIGMLQVALFGENLARKNLDKALNTLLRTPEIKYTVFMAIVENGVNSVSNLELKAYPNPGIYLLQLLKRAQNKGFLATVTLHNFLEETTKGKNPIVPLIRIKDNSSIEISGTGIFKKNKLVAKVGLRDTRALVILRGLKGEGYIPFTIKKNGKVTDEGTVFVKRSRKVRVTRSGDNITYLITVNLNGDLIEHPKITSQKLFIDSNTMPLSEVENAVKMEIGTDCRNFIRKMQTDFKLDCIDINKYAMAKWRNQIENQVDQDEFIQKAKIVVDIKVKIKSLGELT